MAFDEVRLDIAGAPSGIQMTAWRPLDRIMLGDGRTVRNARYAASLLRGDLGPFTRTLADVALLRAFWEARGGGLRGFRVRDRFDYQSCAPGGTPARTDQLIGTGDGVATTFQLVKTYSSGGQSYVRTIRKPVAGTVLVEVDGAPVTPASVNTATGVVTLSAAPATGHLVKAGFEFDVPVVFATDDFVAVLEQTKAGVIASLPIVEDRGA
jgi:uncharacterized protein (TIGR02217 family)